MKKEETCFSLKLAYFYVLNEFFHACNLHYLKETMNSQVLLQDCFFQKVYIL